MTGLVCGAQPTEEGRAGCGASKWRFLRTPFLAGRERLVVCECCGLSTAVMLPRKRRT